VEFHRSLFARGAAYLSQILDCTVALQLVPGGLLAKIDLYDTLRVKRLSRPDKIGRTGKNKR
jgi:hypothetical protein